jgi:hypothetical protein
LEHGKKWAIFKKRSTTTQIESLPRTVLGNPSTKSILISTHGFSAMGRGVNGPALVLFPFAN